MTIDPAPLAKLTEVSPPPRPEVEVDDLDLALLRALAADSRQSQRAIARQIEMSPPAVADRLARLERDQQRLAVERAYDDPLVMAEYRMTGEAFAGAVVAAEQERLVTRNGKRPVLRPLVTVATSDQVLFEAGAVYLRGASVGGELNLVAAGFERTDVERVTRLIKINEYKRRQSPVGIRITHRGFGRDWRYPITSRFRA